MRDRIYRPRSGLTCASGQGSLLAQAHLTSGSKDGTILAQQANLVRKGAWPGTLLWLVLAAPGCRKDTEAALCT